MAYWTANNIVSCTVATAAVGVALQFTALAGPKPRDWPVARAIRRGLTSTSLMGLWTWLCVCVEDIPVEPAILLVVFALTQQIQQWRYEGNRWFAPRIRPLTQPLFLGACAVMTYNWAQNPAFYATAALIFSSLHQRRMRRIHEEFHVMHKMLRQRVARLESDRHGFLIEKSSEKIAKVG